MDKEKVDQILRFCTKCKLVWEYVQYDKQQVNYYENFPTLGKKERIVINAKTKIIK